MRKKIEHSEVSLALQPPAKYTQPESGLLNEKPPENSGGFLIDTQ